MTTQEIADRTGLAQSNVSATLARGRKGNEENFTKIGIALGLPEKQIKDMLISSMFEAIEQEYGAGFSFALKSQFGLSESAIRDVIKFIRDIQKKEQENS
ncbi:hypothetical protein BLM37_04325 [Candidatus Gracilibacteria bacterium GN02-873]|nr:hypothetical protein BLM37_04325 [Candidatus Gracilibacteria bacterium GN02-873]